MSHIACLKLLQKMSLLHNSSSREGNSGGDLKQIKSEMLQNVVSNVPGLVILNEHSLQAPKQHPRVFNLF